MAGLVTEEKFNELVGSTTSYLQNLMDRVAVLEKQVEELSKKPAPKKEAK